MQNSNSHSQFRNFHKEMLDFLLLSQQVQVSAEEQRLSDDTRSGLHLLSDCQFIKVSVIII